MDTSKGIIPLTLWTLGKEKNIETINIYFCQLEPMTLILHTDYSALI